MAASNGSPAIKALEDESAAIEKAQEPTRKKIAELEAELVEGQAIIARNRQAIAILTGKMPVAVSGQRRAGRSRSKAELTADAGDREAKILEIVGGTPQGLNGSQIAERLGTSPATARKALEELVSAGTIKRTGEKRGTKYLPA